jgi:hypothetical protein
MPETVGGSDYLADLHKLHIDELAWLVYAAYVSQLRQLPGMIQTRMPKVTFKRGTVKASDEYPEAVSKTSVWVKTVKKLQQRNVDIPLYVPNLFAVLGTVRLGSLDYPQPEQLSSDAYIYAVQHDLIQRVPWLQLDWDSRLSSYQLEAVRQQQLMRGQRAEDVILSALLEDHAIDSALFGFCTAYSFGTALMRQRAWKHFGDQAALQLFSFWEAYRQAWPMIPGVLWEKAGEIYMKYIRGITHEYEARH